MEFSGLLWTPASFALALLPPLLLFYLQQRKGGTVVPALLLTLPLLPAYFVLHAHLRSPSIRSLLSFPLCWIIPNRLLLLCFHALDCPAWSFSSPSHFLLSVLLPIRIKGPAPTSSSSSSSSAANVLSSHLLLFFYELLALACAAACLVLLPVYASYPLLFLSTFLVIDVFSRAAAIAFYVLYRVELHAAFNNPWLPYSLTEFWGRRWNLLANALLRQSVYNPIVACLSARKARAAKDHVAGGGAKQEVELWVRIVGVWATFFCSGLIHELLWICILQERRWPASWQNTCFFLLHGLATSAEITCRRLLPHLSLKIPSFLKRAFTLAFVHTTMAWLLFAPLRAMPKLYIFS